MLRSQLRKLITSLYKGGAHPDRRAEFETEDADVRFILLRISFNAAFATDLKDDGFSTRDGPAA